MDLALLKNISLTVFLSSTCLGFKNCQNMWHKKVFKYFVYGL